MGNSLKNLYVDIDPGLSKGDSCRRKSPPTCLVSAGYSAWHFKAKSNGSLLARFFSPFALSKCSHFHL